VTGEQFPPDPLDNLNCLQIVNYHVPAPILKAQGRITHAFSTKYYHVDRLMLGSHLCLFAWVFFPPSVHQPSPTTITYGQKHAFKKKFFSARSSLRRLRVGTVSELCGDYRPYPQTMCFYKSQAPFNKKTQSLPSSRLCNLILIY